jgi:hypothetical protein
VGAREPGRRRRERERGDEEADVRVDGVLPGRGAGGGVLLLAADVSALRRRLELLAQRARETLPCRTCGLPPDAPGRVVISTERVPEDPGERCPACGRRLWFVVEVRGPSAPPEDGGGAQEGSETPEGEPRRGFWSRLFGS